MAHKWAQWLHHPCLLGDPQCPARGENHKGPISRHSGYFSPAFSGIPNAQHREEHKNGPHVGTGATSPLPSRGSPMPSTGRKSKRAQKWAQWLRQPCLFGGPQGPARGENQKGPTSGQSGYITPAFSGIPKALQGEKIRNGPQLGTMATSRLPLGGSQCPARGEN